MSDNDRAKIRKFLGDKEMSEAVKRVMFSTFIKDSKIRNVEVMAAERLAINLLNEAFKELERAKESAKAPITKLTQPGL